MKRLIYIIVCMVWIVSCDKKEIDVWNSETFEYSGRFVIEAETYFGDEQYLIPYEEGSEIQIYNTAANVADEIWIDDVGTIFPLKVKFKITGNSSTFTTDQAEIENINSNTLLIDTDYGLAPFTSAYAGYFRVPTAAGQLNDGIQEYTYAILEEGKITPNGATTIGGNTVDGLSLKIILRSDYVTFISYELDEEDWDDPLVPEYGWEYQVGSNVKTTDLDESWTINGYRYTGYPEDATH